MKRRRVEVGRAEGRRLFGANLDDCARARPPYPERVYELLQDRCGLGSGSRVLEIGSGTGEVTKRVIELLPRVIVAVEPDERLAAHLAQMARSADVRVDVLASAFEDVQLSAGSFDVGLAGTSFHWVDQRLGLEKVAMALRPGGWWAMWWTVFGDPSRPDPFRDATDHVLRGLPPGPSAGGAGGSSFALDVEARRADLGAVDSFVRIEAEQLPWTARLSARQIRALYATFSSISRLSDNDQHQILDEIERIANAEFGGNVERPFVTVIYTSQRKPDVSLPPNRRIDS